MESRGRQRHTAYLITLGSYAGIFKSVNGRRSPELRFEMHGQRLFSAATLIAVVAVVVLLTDSARSGQPLNGDLDFNSAKRPEGENAKRKVRGAQHDDSEDQQMGDQDSEGDRQQDQHHDEDQQQNEDQQPDGDEGEDQHQGDQQPQLSEDVDPTQLQGDGGEPLQTGDGNEEQQGGGDELQMGDGNEEEQQQQDDEEGTAVDNDNSRNNDGSTRSSTSHICPSVRVRGLPRGRIGDIAYASCNSGLFNGVWSCDYNERRNDTRWQLIECHAPEDLQFAGSSDFFSTGIAGALETVSDHIDNNTLDLSTAISLIGEISSTDLDESYTFAIEQDTEMAFSFLSSLLKKSGSLTKRERAHSTSRLLRSLDLLALKYIQNSTYFDFGFVKMKIKDINPGPADIVGIQVGQNTIVLPTSDLQDALNYSMTSVKEVSFLFEDLSTSLLDNETAEGAVITPVISTALLCGDTLCDTSNLNLSRSVKIVLEQLSDFKADVETLKCSYWELEALDTDDSFAGYWSQRGCSLNRAESTEGRIVCECTHLTHFAVLLSPGAEIGHKHAFTLSVVGYIGVPLSLVAMAITVLIYGCFRSLWNIRSYIHINLCLSLMVAQSLFLVGIDKTENLIACSFVAVALHYLFLVSFMWMLMEGVVLYVLLVKVFVEGFQKKYIIWFTIASYGLPGVYMCLTIPLGFLLNGERHYGSDTMCWLRYDTHFIWTFIVPVTLIIIINMVLFVMTFIIIHKHRHINNLASVRKWIKPAFSLVTVMGLTWITGVLVFDDVLIPFAYLFTIFVALQGLAIFILFVVMSKQVRDTILKFVRNDLKVEFLNKCLVETKMKEVTCDRSGGTWLRKESTPEHCEGSPRLSGLGLGIGSTLTLNQQHQP